MELTGPRSKHFYYNSMVCLLKAMEGIDITIEMRDFVVVSGKLDFAEATMNLSMSNVTLTNLKGSIRYFLKFYVKGRYIQYVMIPDAVDITKAMEWQLNKAAYFKEKETSAKKKTFQKRQDQRAKVAQKLNRQEHK
ncbi:hypothetical protein BsWGS_10929 [Bradybaena similaris]